MVSRREQITMSPAERLEFLGRERVMICSTIGPRGWPHSMPLWYSVRDGDLWAWTFAKSQKIKNLEREPRCTALVEAGEAYEELRGVQIEAEAELIRDQEPVTEFGRELASRYSGGIESLGDDAGAALAAQAAKRVVIHFRPIRVASWDHRKLGGGY